MSWLGCYISEKLSYKRSWSENIEIICPTSQNLICYVLCTDPRITKNIYIVTLLNVSVTCLLNATINVKEEVILTGDLNVNYLKANDHMKLKAVIASAGLKQLIKKQTRIDGETKTLIDILAMNNPFVIKDTNVIPASISDHEMIGAVRKLNYKKTQSQTKQFRNYKNYNAENVNNRLKNSDWSGVFLSSDVNTGQI